MCCHVLLFVFCSKFPGAAQEEESFRNSMKKFISFFYIKLLLPKAVGHLVE
jgi:hypothetical protein